jgi:hypothetical protein
MKKCGALLLVFALASGAEATLSWSISDIDIMIGTTATVYIVSDSAQAYPTKWIDDTDGSLIDSITALPAAGSRAVVQNPTQSGYADWWTVEAYAYPTDPEPTAIGNQFAVSIYVPEPLLGGNYTIYLDTYGINASLTVGAIIPEPASVFILGLGGLALLRKRRK